LEGTIKKFFPGAGPVPLPPHFQVRFGTTDGNNMWTTWRGNNWVNWRVCYEINSFERIVALSIFLDCVSSALLVCWPSVVWLQNQDIVVVFSARFSVSVWLYCIVYFSPFIFVIINQSIGCMCGHLTLHWFSLPLLSSDIFATVYIVFICFINASYFLS